jgi:RNA polymerase sigma-70 factor (sigma-E family)
VEFEEFLDRELVALTRFAGVLVGNRQDAHDVLADALLAVGPQWQRISRLDHPTAYVRKAVVNRFLADRRKAGRRRTETTGEAHRLDRPVDDVSTAIGNRDLLDRLLRDLPRQQRSVVVLRYYLGLNDAAVADQLGCSVSSVRSNMSRALARLRVSPELLESEARRP